jgi:hypothetical protein
MLTSFSYIDSIAPRIFRLCLAAFICCASACNGPASSSSGQEASARLATSRPGNFRDRTAESGVNFTYRNGEEANHFAILETLGGGVALFDYDGDGLLDLFLTGGGYFDGPKRQEIKGHPSKLYKNLGNWKFRDVTQAVGLHQPLFYTHGCAVTDYDNDGWPDLLVTGWGRLALYHNESDGRGGRRFAEVSTQAGLRGDSWSTSAAWGDLDGDTYADLYICHYVNWSFANNPKCSGYSDDVTQDVCPPKSFSALPHKLFRNNGDGTFADVSEAAGLRKDGKGLGVVMIDVNDDRKVDIYVANDTVDNFLYLNRSTPGKLVLEEVGLPNGVARDDRGVADGSMGVDAADYDGSGRPALWVTNYENEMHGLYRNQGNGFFVHNTQASGIAAIGRVYVGFGTSFLDLDHDGWEDLIITNGHVIRHSTNLRQRPVALRNLRNGRFANITQDAGPYFQNGHLGRGLAAGDLDNDGRLDLVISHQNAPVVLLQNEATTDRHWLGIELAGRNHGDTVGAKLVLEVGGRRLTRFAKGGGSYLSSGDRRHVFGLEKAEKVDRLAVVWPSGQIRQWTGEQLATDRYHRLVEGKEGVEAPRGP